MRSFDYSTKWQKLLTPEIVALLSQIHEYKGEQSLLAIFNSVVEIYKLLIKEYHTSTLMALA